MNVQIQDVCDSLNSEELKSFAEEVADALDEWSGEGLDVFSGDFEVVVMLPCIGYFAVTISDIGTLQDNLLDKVSDQTTMNRLDPYV